VLNTKGELISTIFPPPSSKNILGIDYSFISSRAYVLLANGSICIYQVDKETALLENILNINQIFVFFQLNNYVLGY